MAANGANKWAKSSGAVPSPENEEPTTNITAAQHGGEVVCVPIPSAPATPQDGNGCVLEQGEGVPKRGRVVARYALASEKRVEQVLDRLAAISAKERALVADAMADRWGIVTITEAVGDDGLASANNSVGSAKKPLLLTQALARAPAPRNRATG